MISPLSHVGAAALLLLLAPAAAQDCAVRLESSYPAPVAAPGYNARLIASGLSRPRSILFDKNKNLLVVEAGTGIQRLSFSSDDGGTCLVVGDTKNLVSDRNVRYTPPSAYTVEELVLLT